MANVPVENGFGVQSNPTAIPFKSASVSPDAFNATLGLDSAARGMIYESKAIQEQRDKANDLLAIEKSTQFDNIILQNLHDKDNGLYAKSGKAYLDSMQPTIENLNKAKESLIENLDDDQRVAVLQTLDKKLINVQQNIEQNSIKENEMYKTQTLSDLINTQTQMALLNRNDSKSVINNIGNINASIENIYGSSVDAQTIKAMQKKATSDLLINVLEGRIADKNLYAKDFYDMFKSQIDPAKQPQLVEAINSVDVDVHSRLFADEWFNSGLTEEQAYEKAYEIKDLDLRDATEAKVSQRYGRVRELQKQTYNDNLDKFWKAYADNPDVNNIPAWMEGKDRITARNYALSDGKPKSDADTYVDLYEMSATNADAFSKVNLNDYRDRLTKDEYKTFAKRQQDIIQHGYTTITPDDKATKKVVNSVLKSYGSWNVPNRQGVTTIMQNIINEEERRAGKKYSAEELKAVEQRISGWLGYSKDGSAIKVINQNSMKADFYKGLANDVSYFEKVHKRQPDANEYRSLLYQRANSSLQDHNQNIYKNIQHTSARPKETKAVTYFAHSYLPELGKKLGVNLNVSSDQIFNPKSKNYESWHNVKGVSHAVDVGMSGRPNATKFDIISNILKDFPQAKIGTSDAVILREFKDKRKMANVIDERGFDKQHGTNHTDHIHVTLNIGDSDVVVAKKAPSAPSGKVIVADKEGNRFYLPEKQLAEAVKQGYKKI